MNIISAHEQQFDTRICMCDPLININGETFDCVIKRDDGPYTGSHEYHVTVDGKPMLSFKLWHVIPVGDLIPSTMYQIERASDSGGDATLIMPLLFARETEEDDVDF